MGFSATHLETPGGRAGLLFTFQDVTGIKKLERDAAISRRLAAVGSNGGRHCARDFGIRWLRCPGRFRFCGRNCAQQRTGTTHGHRCIRESERLNMTIRSFLAYARPQRFQIAAFESAPRAERYGAPCCANSADVDPGHVIGS